MSFNVGVLVPCFWVFCVESWLLGGFLGVWWDGRNGVVMMDEMGFAFLPSFEGFFYILCDW